MIIITITMIRYPPLPRDPQHGDTTTWRRDRDDGVASTSLQRLFNIQRAPGEITSALGINGIINFSVRAFVAVMTGRNFR